MKTKVQVYSDGECRWLSPYFSSTSCNIDSTHFPFDEQTCQVEIASWTAAGNVIDVELDKKLPVDTSNYLENIQWKLQSVSAFRQVSSVVAFCYKTRSHLGSFSSVQQGRSSESYGIELMIVKTLGLLFSTGKDKWVLLALKS